MADVLRIYALGWDLYAMLSTQVCMTLEHACLSVEDQWVIELRNLNLVPCLTEDEVALQDLVLESGTERPFWCALFDHLLDLTTDPADCAQLRTCELGNLEA